METLVISNSRWKYLLLLVASLGFVGAGVLILQNERSTGAGWIAWSSILFFGACAAVFIWQLFDSRPRLKLDDRGVEDRTLGVGVIPWCEITDAYVKSIKSNDFVCLVVRNPSIWVDKFSPVQKRLMEVNRSLGFQELNINLGGT